MASVKLVCLSLIVMTRLNLLLLLFLGQGSRRWVRVEAGPRRCV